MRLNPQEISSHYQSILRRAPLSAEVTYWMCFAASGGSAMELRRDLASGREFEAELREEFAQACRYVPSIGDVEECRIRIVAGEALEIVVRDFQQKLRRSTGERAEKSA